MKNLLQNIAEIVIGPNREVRRNREFVTIGGQIFAVAHSREEMAKIMRVPDRKVAGYVLQHRM